LRRRATLPPHIKKLAPLGASKFNLEVVAKGEFGNDMAMEGLEPEFPRPILIIQLWRGEIALWKTFWLFCVGGGLALGLPIFSAMLALTDVPDDTIASIFLAALGVLLLYVIWVFVGVWRAANNYQGDKAWAVLAKIAVVAGTFNIGLLMVSVLFADTG
jgi:hypothetical protein